MTPYRGIGANIALRDAALLGSKLVEAFESGREVTESIGEYEAKMREYSYAAVSGSKQTLDRAVGPKGMGFSLFKSAMRAVNAMPTVKRKFAERM